MRRLVSVIALLALGVLVLVTRDAPPAPVRTGKPVQMKGGKGGKGGKRK